MDALVISVYNKIMKIGIVFLGLILLCGGLFAQTVAEDEIRVPQTVNFQNNEGIPDKVETVAEIRGIGVFMGQNTGARERQYFGRYRVLHIVDPAEPELFDADIIIIEPAATVDHIRNLRFIVSGYLGAAYGYSDRDAAVLAEFVTIYNAVYRRNMAYFASRYKNAVMSHMDAARAGLSTNWREWPGGTQMLVPLRSGAAPGSLSVIDTSVITDSNVIEEMRRQDDMSIETRRDMIDLQERQIEERERALDEERRQTEEESRAVAQREQELSQQIQEAQRETIAATTEEQRQEAQAREEALRQEAARVEEERAAVEDRQTAIAREETAIQEMRSEVRDDRREIARDQEKLLSREAAAAAGGIPFIKVGSASTGRLLLIDPRTGGDLGSGEEQTVTVRLYEAFGRGLAVVLQRQGSDAGRLCILDRSTLSEVIAAREEVYPRSHFHINGTELFVVIRDEGKWYLGKYDSSLSLLARSRTEVHPETFILFSDAYIFVEDPNGMVIPLSLTLN